MTIPIQTPRPGQLLREAFGLRGSVKPVLEESIVPVVNVADLALASTIPIRRQAVARFFQAAVAGEYPVIEIATPAGIIARILKAFLWSGSAGDLYISHGNALGATPAIAISSRFLDWRLLSPNFTNPAIIPTRGTDAAGLTSFQEVYRLATANAPLEIDWTRIGGVVIGGTSTTGYWQLQAATANVTLNGSIIWEEYQLDEIP